MIYLNIFEAIEHEFPNAGDNWSCCQIGFKELDGRENTKESLKSEYPDGKLIKTTDSEYWVWL